MVNTAHNSWHAQRNSDQQHSMSGITKPKLLREENNNLPSPSKSLQDRRIRRGSSNSLESIQSIKVEYETLAEARKDNKEVSRTENVKSRSGVISNFLKPKFLKSKSSLDSSGSMDNIIRSESNFITKQRQSTIEDFADTSSEEENSKQYVYDAESINSILEEYQMRNSSYISPTKKNDFIFKEDFNDSSDLNRSRLSNTNRTNSTRNSIHTPIVITKFSQVKRNNHKSTIERTLGNNSSLSSSGNSSSPTKSYDRSKDSNGTNSDSSNSSKFKIYTDKQNEGGSDNRKKVDRRNIISTSSNVDVFNRTSLSNLTTISNIDFSMTDENKYPASNGSTSRRQSKRQSENRFLFDVSNNILEDESNILERVLQPKDRTSIFSERFPNTNQINMDETAIKNTTKDITNSSISTNELLYKLETFYDNDNNDNTRESISKESKDFYDLTAGVDSKTKLPVMLYKVQDKNYFERTNRWSVDDRTQKNMRSNTSPALSLQNVTQEYILKPFPGPSIPVPEISKSRLGQYSSTASITLEGKLASLNSVPSQIYGTNIPDEKRSSLRELASSGIQSHASVTPFTPNNYLQDTISKSNSHEHMLNNTPSINYNTFDSTYDDLEKNHLKPPVNRVPNNIHSWPFFILVMTIGLIVPPIYILLTVGFFDKNTYYRQHSPQLTYLVVNSDQNKRFSKTQKLVSFILGLVWLCIVLAMIGVGIGVGIRRES